MGQIFVTSFNKDIEKNKRNCFEKWLLMVVCDVFDILISFIGKLYTHLVDLKTTISPSILFYA
jgi:hypothetical protein